MAVQEKCDEKSGGGGIPITLRVSFSHEIFTSRNALLRIIGSRD
jgi:hypothetical protein